MYRKLSLVAVLAVAFFVAVSAQSTKCTGYPKMYNGKPCASTTRYYDGQMGACGCGTGNSSPFPWQATKPTAAASPPVFGANTWCGSGCGKCFKLTPTAIGASPAGTGAKAINSVVLKVTNLCPPEGNEQWCAYDVNSYGYDAHFDIMDYNMAGLVTSMGWDNPEVTYEEVDCATNGYTDWNCQCASGGSTSGSSTSGSSTKATAAPTTVPKATASPTTAPKATAAPTTAPKAPTTAPKAPTTAPKAPTTAPKATTAPAAPTIQIKPIAPQATTAPTTAPSTPVSNSGLGITVMGGSSQYWFGFQVDGLKTFTQVQVKDSSDSAAWTTMAYQGDSHWGMYYVSPGTPMKLPLSLQITTSAGTVVAATNVVTSFDAVAIKTGLSL